MPIQQLPPNSQLPPDLAGQLAQLQMRQQLSQALLGESMKPINPTRSAGRYIIPISPLEGLSQLGSTALNAKSLSDAYAGTAGIYAQAQGRRNSALSDALLGDQSSKLPPGLQVPGTDPTGAPGFNSVPGQQSSSGQVSMGGNARETPQDIYREALKVAPSFGQDALTLLGDGPYKLRLEAALRRQDPTETAKLVSELGLDRNSPVAQAAYRQKLNPPIVGREGSAVWQYGDDGMPHQVAFSPKLDIGQTQSPEGDVKTTPGFAQSLAEIGRVRSEIAGRTAAAEASGKAPFELIDVVDPKSGMTYQVPKSSKTGSLTAPVNPAVGPAAPASTIPAGNVKPAPAISPTTQIPTAAPVSGPVPAKGMPSKLSPQQTAEMTGRGDELQKYGADLNQRANGARDNNIRLAELQTLNVDGTSGALAKGKQRLGEYALALNMSPEWVKQNIADVPPMQAFEKLTLQLASQQAKQLTSRPTGAEFTQFISANPNLGQTPQGRARVMKFMGQMNELTLQEQQQAQAYWDKNKTLDGFQSQFNKAIESDPKSLLNQLRAENVTVKKSSAQSAPQPNVLPNVQSVEHRPDGSVKETMRNGETYIWKDAQSYSNWQKAQGK